VLAARTSDVHALEAQLVSWEAPALAQVAGTWLGQIDARLYFGEFAHVINPDGSTTQIAVTYLDENGQALEKICLDDMVDALLYLGPQDNLTLIPPHSR
jgi:putative heme degradation protein